MPAAHALQLDAPALVYFPAIQSMHAVEASAAGVGEAFPAEHGVQLGWPVVLWYVPTAQAMQLDELSAPVVDEYEPFGQLVQLDWAAALW